jgi:chloramphenicol-sensitive protein RarD
LAAYGLWGLVPLYFKTVTERVSALELLAHRILWTLVFLLVLATATHRWQSIGGALRHRRTFVLLATSSALIACNWFTYIYSVHINEIRQASLGFYITPLVTTFLGMVVLGERLRSLQWLSLGMAAVAVGLLIALVGSTPWIAFNLAITFSFYSLVRKKAATDALGGLVVETMLIAPVAAILCVWWHMEGTLVFGRSLELDGTIAASGVVTAIPLLCFGQAARRLPLATLGFMQYLSPTIQLMLAVWLYGEELSQGQWCSFALIWAALLIFSIDSVRAYQGRRGQERMEAGAELDLYAER